jgi:hypothetical protein
VNISPEFYLYDDDEFPRLTGNSVGDGEAAYGEKSSSWISNNFFLILSHFFAISI